MVLINEASGVLTGSREFAEDPRYKVVQEAKKVALADVFRVHDFNYLMKVIQISKKLESADNTIRVRLGMLKDC